MSKKYLDENGLSHLWSKIKSIFVQKTELEESIADVQKCFMVTCYVDFANGTITNVSKSLADIQAAFNRNEHIFIVGDISQLMPGAKSVLPLMIINENQAVFSATVYLNSEANCITAGVRPSQGNFLVVTPLVDKAQLDIRLGGLTFSSSATPVDNENVITFIDEG